jgi:TolB-like protein
MPAGIIRKTVMAAVVLLATILATGPAIAQEEVNVSDRLAEAIRFYGELEFDKGIELVQNLLSQTNLNPRDSIAGLATLSMLTYGKGEDYIKRSFGYLEKIAEVGPCVIHLPHEIWPQQLRNQWYQVLQARKALTCPEENPEIKTIAIMEFDNYSVEKFQEELGFITKGVADFFEADFSRLSTLKVVERDKIDFILKEIELAKAGMIDASDAVRVGKLLGAQLMVFGSITQLDSKKAKMLIKAVKVETSEIIAFVEKEGKPDYFKMQKELVRELADKLEITINEEAEVLLDEGGTDSYDAATLYSKGLYYMDQYDYVKAYEFFKLAYEKDNTFVEAKRKMDIYHPLVSS